MVTYTLNIFHSMFCCLDIRQLQMIFASQIILDNSLSKYLSSYMLDLDYSFVLKIATICNCRLC